MIIANQGIIVSDEDGANMFMLTVGSLSTDWAWVNVTRLLSGIYLIEESTDGECVCMQNRAETRDEQTRDPLLSHRGRDV